MNDILKQLFTSLLNIPARIKKASIKSKIIGVVTLFLLCVGVIIPLINKSYAITYVTSGNTGSWCRNSSCTPCTNTTTTGCTNPDAAIYKGAVGYQELPINNIAFDELDRTSTGRGLSSGVNAYDWTYSVANNTDLKIYTNKGPLSSDIGQSDILAYKTSTWKYSSTVSVPGTFTIVFRNGARLPQGTRADVKLTLSNMEYELGAKVSGAAANTEKYFVLLSIRDSKTVFSSTPPKASGSSLDYNSTIAGARVGTSISAKIEVTKPGSCKKNDAKTAFTDCVPIGDNLRDMIYGMRDIDIKDYIHDNYTGAYSEGVYLYGGFSGPVTLSTNTLLDLTATDSNNLRIRAGATDSGTINSTFMLPANANEFNFRWVGSHSAGGDTATGTSILETPTVAVKATVANSTGGTIEDDAGHSTASNMTNSYIYNSSVTFKYAPDSTHVVTGLKLKNKETNTETNLPYSKTGGEYTIDKLYKNPENTSTSAIYEIEVTYTQKVTRTARFYYNNNSSCNGSTITYKDVSCETVGTNGTCDILIPSEVTSSVGKFNGTYNGFYTSMSNMSSVSTTSESKTLHLTLKGYGIGVGSYKQTIYTEVTSSDFTTDGKLKVCLKSDLSKCIVSKGRLMTWRGQISVFYNDIWVQDLNTPSMDQTDTQEVAYTRQKLTLSASATYYAHYSKPITNYYYSSSYTNRTLHRNEWISSVSGSGTMGASLSTTASTTTNYCTDSSDCGTGPSSAAWQGLSTGQDSSAEYTTVAGAATASTCYDNLWTVYKFTATFAKGANVSGIGANSGSCNFTTSAVSCPVALPSITANSGYTPVGWSTTNGASTGTAAGGTYTISNNSTKLYANAKESDYVVEYNCGSGSTGTPPASQSVASGGAITIQSGQGNCRNSNMSFVGWYSPSLDGSTPLASNWTGWHTDSWGYTNGQYGITNKKLTLTAKWAASNFTIKYSCGTGSGTPPADQPVAYNQTVTIPSGPGGCYKNGYNFTTWNDPTGDHNWTGWTGTWVYQDGQYGITNSTLVLTAQYDSPKCIKITLDPSPGSGGTQTFSYKYGTSTFYNSTNCTGSTLSDISKPTRTGYTLQHYAGDGTSGGENGERYVSYYNGSDYIAFASDLATDIYKDATMYASWTPNAYTLTVDPNGGTWNGSSSVTTATQNYNTTKSIPAPTRKGYKFVGWAESGSGSLGKLTNADSSFDTSTGGISVYNNSGNGMVTHTLTSSANLLTDYDTSFTSYANGATTLFTNQMNSGTQEIVSDVGGAAKALHFNSSGGQGRAYRTAALTSGKTYTLSADFYSTSVSSSFYAMHTEMAGGDYNWTGDSAAYTTPGKWQRLSITWTPTSDTTLYYFFHAPTGGDTYVKNIKLEESSTPTAYTSGSSLAVSPYGNREIRINTANGTTQPGLGGFVQGAWSAANNTTIHAFVAKIPVGYSIYHANNAVGTGSTATWLTSTAGTGKYEVYAYQWNFGSSGTFNDYGYVYITSGTKPMNWNLAYSHIFNVTNGMADTYTYGAGNGRLTALWVPEKHTLTADANGGSITSATGWSSTEDVATKGISYNDEYGTLPSVSRAGYTFKGWSQVPEGYKQVEYLESSGTQYIDVGTNFNSNSDRFEIDYQANDAIGNYFIAGSGWTENGKMWVYSYNAGSRFSTYITDTSGNQREFFGFDGPDTSRHMVVYDAKKMYVDNKLTADNSGYTFGNTPYNFSLFNAINSTGYFAKTKIYSFKMYKSGSLVRNMIPCVRESDGKAGMYDTVNNVFYSNAGTGEFSVGDASYVTASKIYDIDASSTIYAKWEANVYSVTLNNQNATTAGTTKVWYQYNTTKIVNGVECYYYTDSSLTTCLSGGYNIVKPTKSGYAYDGYFTETGGSGTMYVDEYGTFTNNIYQKIPSEINSSYTTDITLYAKWLNVYSITLNNQNATAPGTKKVWYIHNETRQLNGVECYYFTNSDLTSCLSGGYYITNPTKTGYTFGGYYTVTNGGGTQYVNSASPANFINNIYTKTPSEINSSYTTDITLYAKWTGISYTVTANANGGSIASTTGWTGTGNTATKSVAYGSAYGTLPNVSKTSAELKGWSLVPEGYKQVAYIQSTGTQYIDTGAKIFNSNSHEIYIDFEPTAFYNYNTIWGSTHDADTFEGWIYENGSLASRYNDIRYGTDNTIQVNTRYKMDLYKSGTSLYKYVNNAEYGSGTSATHSSTANLLLFLSGSDYGKYKLYDSKIYNNGTLIRNFVPCVRESDGVAGLYDTVNGVFYTNAGSGTFTAPSTEVFITSSTINNIPANHTIYAKWSEKFTPTITKTIVSPKSLYKAGDTITYNIKVTNTAAYPITNVVVEDPNATITSGTGYTVSNNKATISSLASGASVTITATKTLTTSNVGTFTNTATITSATAENAELDGTPTDSVTVDVQSLIKISKTVEGNMADNGDYFKVKVTIGGTQGHKYTISGQSYTGSDKQTIYTVGTTDNYIFLKHGETITIGGGASDNKIAPGTTYSIEETTDYPETYINGSSTNSKSSGNLTTSNQTNTNTVTIKNKKDQSVATGINTKYMPYIMIAVIIILAVCISFMITKIKNNSSY